MKLLIFSYKMSARYHLPISKYAHFCHAPCKIDDVKGEIDDVSKDKTSLQISFLCQRVDIDFCQIQ